MTIREPYGEKIVGKIDRAIRERIQDARESDEQGNPVAAVPASDKHGIARECGVEMEVIQERLDTICEQVRDTDEHAAVPRYRLRTKGRNREEDA